jgi:hypothetical protein
MREVELLVGLQHSCILPIIGYSLPTQEAQAQVGMEFVVNDSLRFAVNQSPRPSFMDGTGIAIIIYGVAY